MIAMIVLIAIVAVIALWAIGTYNSLVKLRNKADEAEAGIDAHLQQRYDLVPNLVETVKGYAKHESATLENVISARNAAISAKGIKDKAEADDILTDALKSVFALAESYPDLKASQGFSELQRQLQTIEEDILSSRKYYNAVARELNDRIMVFPASLVASIFRFGKRDYIEAGDDARSRVEVRF